LAVVRIVSDVFCPVRALSLCCVSTDTCPKAGTAETQNNIAKTPQDTLLRVRDESPTKMERKTQLDFEIEEPPMFLVLLRSWKATRR